MKGSKKLSIFITPVIVMILMFSISSVSAKEHEMIQFTSDGHVLGFEKTGIYAATGSHVLRIGFAGTKGVVPEAVTGSLDSKKAMPLGEVRYPGLWKGITLVYTRTDKNIFESTYYIEPNADAGDIRLVYNVPVTKTKNGSLNFQFETGCMTESPPVAWQEINNKKVPVSVSFKKIAENEAGFALGQYNHKLPLIIDPVLSWNTFMGSSNFDSGNAIAVDGAGFVYVAGNSSATWGSPVTVNAHAGKGDAFAAKLNSSGALLWNTFMGSSDLDSGYAIAVDGSGNVYVAGRSNATWGGTATVHGHAGHYDAFAAKLNNSGALLWNTFMGSTDIDEGYAIAVDGAGFVYVAGSSIETWGSPVRAYTWSYDAFAAKLNSSGALQWNTFLGSPAIDYGNAIAVDGSGNVYVAGHSSLIWGSPVSFPAGDYDAFAAKLNSSGTLQWNTFMGSSGFDSGYAIAVDGAGFVYVAGSSNSTWGSPVNAHAGGTYDAFAAKLDSSGALQWNTFMGSSGFDSGKVIAVDGSDNVYVTGYSDATWGSPVNAHAGGNDAFAAKLNSSGALQWNTFIGSSANDRGNAMAVDDSANVYVAGRSDDATWGSPVSAHAGDYEAFAVKFSSNRAMPWIPLLLLND